MALQFSCLFGSLWSINAPEPVVEPEGRLGSEVESCLLSFWKIYCIHKL